MTCIVGINYKDTVAMAGDFLCSSTDDFSVFTGPPKVIDGPGYHIGLAGSARVDVYLKKILRRKRPYKSFRSSDDVTGLVEDLEREILKRDTIVTVESDETDFINYPFELLIISKHGLWTIESDLAVYQFPRFAAIGSGESVAMGALDAINQLGIDDVEQTLQVAMTAAGNQVLNVGKEYWTRLIRK